MRSSLALLACLSLVQGCYLGRSPTGKKLAYLGNGLLVAGGATVIAIDSASAAPNGLDLRPEINTVGAIAALVGLAGLLVDVSLDSPPAKHGDVQVVAGH